jgi:PPOX class probable F420-dependent enzyme
MHRLRKSEQECEAVEMPFVRVRAPDAVQYRDVCTGVTGAIGTSYSVIGGTMIIHLTTINLDGSPQVTVVWVGIEDDEFVCAHMGVWKKVQNMQREPRVALSMLGQAKNALGLHEYLVVYGQARIIEGGGAALLQRLAYSYIGPGVVFPPEPIRSQPGFITHIKPERFTGTGPWNQAHGS